MNASGGIRVECRLMGAAGEIFSALAPGFAGIELTDGLDLADVVIIGTDQRAKHLEEVGDALDRGLDVVSLFPGRLSPDGNGREPAERAVAAGGRLLSLGALEEVAIEALAATLSLASHKVREIQVATYPNRPAGKVRIVGKPPIEAHANGFGPDTGAAVILRAIRLLPGLPAGLFGIGDLPAMNEPGRSERTLA